METLDVFQVIDEIESGYAPNLEAAQRVGEYLFSLLMPSEILVAFSRAHVLLEEDEYLRLRLNVRPSELARLPWELLYNPYEKTFLATRRTMPLVRFIDSNASPLMQREGEDINSLLVQSNPKDLDTLNLSASQLAIFKTLGRHSDITTLTNITPSRLREELQGKTAFHLFHYDGHSHLENDTNNGFLSLEDSKGSVRYLSASELSNYLDGTSIKLVVLASCESSATSQRFIGIAQHLIKSNNNLHAVIAMQFAVSDEAAIAFSQGFYKALTNGFPVDIAMSSGRLAIVEAINDSQSIEWATPAIFMRTNDGNLFNFNKE